MTDRTDRLDRNGQRRGHPAASAHTTLPPLPSLQEPLYVIPDRKEPLGGKPAVLRWPGFMGQFGGFAKLGSGSRQAANLVSSSALVPIAPYASSGVRPFSPECGRRLL